MGTVEEAAQYPPNVDVNMSLKEAKDLMSYVDRLIHVHIYFLSNIFLFVFVFS